MKCRCLVIGIGILIIGACDSSLDPTPTSIVTTVPPTTASSEALTSVHSATPPITIHGGSGCDEENVIATSQVGNTLICKVSTDGKLRWQSK